MILENKQEKDAFEFVLNLASELTSRAGCNDLEKQDMEKFRGLTVPTDDNGKIVQREITYDFDICMWLNEQKKEIGNYLDKERVRKAINKSETILYEFSDGGGIKGIDKAELWSELGL